MAAHGSAEWSSALKGGVIAGMIGGIVASLLATAISLASGESIWAGAQVAAFPFFGERVLQPGFELDLVLIGVLSHFAVSIAWGLGFAILFCGLSIGATIAAGFAWGIIVWLAMFYVVLPLTGAAQVAEITPMGRAIVEHVVFAVSVAVGFLPFQRAHHPGVPWLPPVPGPGPHGSRV